jgi:protein-S-isoprenylcysteine O-methyltransferase Ste14
MMRAIAIIGVFPAVATVWFFVFWRWFDRWRAHRAFTYALAFVIIAGWTAATIVLRDDLLAWRVDMPAPIAALGWIVIALSFVLGVVADRQIGWHVRSFAPFFDRDGSIDLVTNGAYGIVRHPIYSSGIWFQIGVFLATGYVAVAIALVVYAAGAAWFTRQEERRLVEIIADRAEYDRYRARVPALIPFARRKVRAG